MSNKCNVAMGVPCRNKLFVALFLLVASCSQCRAFSVVGNQRSSPLPFTSTSPTTVRSPGSELYLFKRVARFFGGNRNKKTEDGEPSPDLPEPKMAAKPSRKNTQEFDETVSVCIIGGGVSGLSAAISCTKGLAKASPDAKVVVLEAASSVGGRVKSDKTDDGYTLDQGFAVFIEAYPEAKKLLDYDELQLGRFLPGALVKVRKSRTTLARIGDPLREPQELLPTLLAPVGDIFDKLGFFSLVLNLKSKTIEELFLEKETSTIDALKLRWKISDVMLDRFFKPFLEGIYLTRLDEQSSRMLSFVLKMFGEDSVSLPKGGIGSIAEQLAGSAKNGGAEIRLDTPVIEILNNEDKTFTISTKEGRRIKSDAVIVATDGEIAERFIAQLDGFESLEQLPSQAQRSVGCLYYGFTGEPPVQDPILILNGIGDARGKPENPINNVCFPSAVAEGYAPDGHSLCSVTVLKEAMDRFEGRDAELDAAVREELGTWFPSQRAEILNEWELKRIYNIKNAQPGQFQGPFPANVYGGRKPSEYRGKPLPKGLFVCGDHVASATLNGALESGVNAGSAAAKSVPKPKKTSAKPSVAKPKEAAVKA